MPSPTQSASLSLIKPIMLYIAWEVLPRAQSYPECQSFSYKANHVIHYLGGSTTCSVLP